MLVGREREPLPGRDDRLVQDCVPCSL